MSNYINLSVPPVNEEERLLRVRFFTQLAEMELRERKISGKRCSKCKGSTILIDLTPETTECQACGHIEEI